MGSASGLEILNLHAQGGMAEVYRARAVDDAGRAWTYAVKRMLPELLKDADVKRMFIEEQRIAACLVHDNIVRVFDVARADTSDTYIVMEFLEGRDLGEVLAAASKLGKTLSVWLAVHIAREVLKALHYAYTTARDKSGRALALIHRDISPHNVFMCSDGQVKLTDFGVAKVATSEVRTKAGIIKGKFGYMSPEQLGGSALDARSDLYNVGILLYESLTAEQLFSGETATASVSAMMKNVIPPFPAELRVPAELDKLIRRALTKDRAQRPQAAQEMELELAAIAARYNLGATRGHVAAELRTIFPDLAPPPPPLRPPTQPKVLTRLTDAPLPPVAPRQPAAPKPAPRLATSSKQEPRPGAGAGSTLETAPAVAHTTVRPLPADATSAEPPALADDAAQLAQGAEQDPRAFDARETELLVGGFAQPLLGVPSTAPNAASEEDFTATVEVAPVVLPADNDTTAPVSPAKGHNATSGEAKPHHRVSTGSRKVIPIDDDNKR